MRIINVFKKHVEANEELVLSLSDNCPGDTVVSEVYVELTENNNVLITGCVAGDDWHIVRAVDMGEYKPVSAITKSGYYLIPAAALAQLKLVFSDAGDVVIKETF